MNDILNILQEHYLITGALIILTILDIIIALLPATTIKIVRK